jgi:hypothetical protein
MNLTTIEEKKGMTAEKKSAVRTKINALYETCGNIRPLIYFIEGLTKEFNAIVGQDCKVFEARLAEVERVIDVYYNKDGVRVNPDKSRMVYSVRNANETEGRYFFYVELANLYIREQIKKTINAKYYLSKIFNGYSVIVESPIFFG